MQKLSRPEKVLLALYELSGGSNRPVKFEDVVVKLFKDYPGEFSLRGYEQYPDSGDLVHKPLYDAKKKGLLTAGSKIFVLTDRGLAVVEKIKAAATGKKIKSNKRLPRWAENEIKRILRADGFTKLFLGDERDKVLDTDFYAYLGVTVRTEKNDFSGRVQTMKSVIDELESLEPEYKQPLYDRIVDYHKFLFEKFSSELVYKSEK